MKARSIVWAGALFVALTGCGETESTVRAKAERVPAYWRGEVVQMSGNAMEDPPSCQGSHGLLLDVNTPKGPYRIHVVGGSKAGDLRELAEKIKACRNRVGFVSRSFGIRENYHADNEYIIRPDQIYPNCGSPNFI